MKLAKYTVWALVGMAVLFTSCEKTFEPFLLKLLLFRRRILKLGKKLFLYLILRTRMIMLRVSLPLM